MVWYSMVWYSLLLQRLATFFPALFHFSHLLSLPLVAGSSSHPTTNLLLILPLYPLFYSNLNFDSIQFSHRCCCAQVLLCIATWQTFASSGNYTAHRHPTQPITLPPLWLPLPLQLIMCAAKAMWCAFTGFLYFFLNLDLATNAKKLTNTKKVGVAIGRWERIVKGGRGGICCCTWLHLDGAKR